jgi:hypothetical protein
METISNYGFFMLPIEKFRLALGKKTNEMSDEEIDNLRIQQDKLADILFDFWLGQKNNNNTLKK